MIDEFWREYNQCLFAYNYHELKRNYYQKCIRWISILSYIITAVSLAGWGFTGEYALIWSIIIFSSQLANGLKDQFGISKTIWTLDAYLQSASEELAKITEGWRLIVQGKLTEDEIFKRVTSHTNRFSQLECKYILPLGIGESFNIIKAAEIKTNKDLEIKHGKDESHDKQPIWAV